MQNTVQWIQALIDANKQYSLLIYPRKTHGISGEAARTQLFERIEKHFIENLKRPPIQFIGTNSRGEYVPVPDEH